MALSGRSRRYTRAGLVAALALHVCVAHAQKATPAPPAPATVTTEIRGAVSGTTQRLAYFTALNADCTSAGYPAVHVWRHPNYGAVHIARGQLYPRSAAGSDLARCDAHPAPATIVQYRAPAGFIGTDVLAFTVTWPSGELRAVSLKLIVAPDDFQAPDLRAPQTEAPEAPATGAPAGIRHVAWP